MILVSSFSNQIKRSSTFRYWTRPTCSRGIVVIIHVESMTSAGRYGLQEMSILWTHTYRNWDIHILLTTKLGWYHFTVSESTWCFSFGYFASQGTPLSQTSGEYPLESICRFSYNVERQRISSNSFHSKDWSDGSWSWNLCPMEIEIRHRQI